MTGRNSREIWVCDACKKTNNDRILTIGGSAAGADQVTASLIQHRHGRGRFGEFIETPAILGDHLARASRAGVVAYHSESTNIIPILVNSR